MLRRRSGSLLLAGLASAALIFAPATPVIASGSAATPASAASALQASYQLRAPAVAPLVTWVPWDGFHITTQAKCLARKQYISQTYQIPLSSLRCVQEGLPPCTYWILEVDADRAPAPHIADRTRTGSEFVECG